MGKATIRLMGGSAGATFMLQVDTAGSALDTQLLDIVNQVFVAASAPPAGYPMGGAFIGEVRAVITVPATGAKLRFNVIFTDPEAAVQPYNSVLYVDANGNEVDADTYNRMGAPTVPVNAGGIIATAQSMVKDQSGRLTTYDWNQAVLLALARYNKDRPRKIVVDITGDGGYDYPIPGWEMGYSVLDEAYGVEYPIGEQNPSWLVPRDDYQIYQDPTAGEVLRFLTQTLDAGQTARVTFMGRWTDPTTIPPSDIDALANLVAAEACETLATSYAQTMNRSFGADVVKFESLSGNYAKRASSLRKLYEAHVGADKDLTPAAGSCSTKFDNTYPDGTDRLVHRKRRF